MGTRFLAVLAVVALGASSAFVGLSMASGDWQTVGQGLEPGQAYAVMLGDGADRLKLEVVNVVSDPVASFSIYAPDGARAGFFALDGNTRSAELVAGKGIWTLFVYKAQGADLQVAVHGQPDAGKFQPADVERREVLLGNVKSTQAVDSSYTAIVGKEPVLANLYLQGSARNFVSQLETSKGIVELISESEVAAAQTGAIVDARGERTTLPQNLASGPFTAKVKADSLSGSLMLVTLYIEVPEFDLDVPVPDEADREERDHEEDAKDPPRHKHKPHAQAAPRPGRPVAPVAEWAECGTASSRVPYAVDAAGALRVTLEESVDPFVTVFDPLDQVLAVVQLEEEGDSAEVPLPYPGEYVVYSRGMDVLVEVLGVAGCELRELDIEPVSIAVLSGEVLGGSSEEVPFELTAAPLEFGLRMNRPDSVAMDVRAVFTGPEGEAAQYYQSFGTAFIGDRGFGGLGGLFFGEGNTTRGHGDYAEVDAAKLLAGEWLLNVDAGLMNGDLEAFALHYLREAAEADEDGN